MVGRRRSAALGAVLGVAAMLAAGGSEARECRTPRPKIVGGSDATLSNWPGQAAIRLDAGRGPTYLCGGTAITKRWILTAAHCLDAGVQDALAAGGALEVVLGVGDLRKAQATNLYPVVEQKIFPGYDDAVLKGDDIALLKLGRDYDGSVMPLSITSRTDPDVGQPLRVAGFGRTRSSVRNEPLDSFVENMSGRWAAAGSPRLLEATVSAVDGDSCLTVNQYRERQDGPLITPAVGGEQLCAAPDVPEGERQGSCQGDSGGPLVAYRNGCPIQVGLVSWAYQCGRPDYPTVFTRVSAYAEWIETTIGETPSTIRRLDPPSLISRADQDSLTQQLTDLVGSPGDRLTLSLPGDRRRFRVGDEVAFTVRSEVSGRLFLLDLNADGVLTQIFPNDFTPSPQTQRIAAGQTLVIPNEEQYDELKAFEAVEPLGDSMLIAVVVPAEVAFSTQVAREFSATKGFKPKPRASANIKDLVAEIEAVIGGDRESWALEIVRYEIIR